MEGKYFLMYSVSQRITAIDTWDSMLRSNWKCALENKDSGYMLMGVFDSYEAASAAGMRLRRRLGLLPPADD